MSAEAFDRLLYTDCRAGTGRGAGGGFQVQAQSAGIDVAQSRMAVSWLLYEAQNAWIMQRRAIEEFPPGFAHTYGDGYGTAQSRYVGQEATGGRQGNHLADCLLTRNPDLYGPTRPAQLWRSELWRAEPWASTDCPQLDGEPPLGPLTIDAVAQWLSDRPERAVALERMLSVVEDPAGRRVVLVATSPDEAVTWIAAATLLLPVRLALEISFKVFCVNPLRAEQRIVAVPRELNPQVAPNNGASVFVLDAEQCSSDDAEVSDRARFLVGLLAGGEDPYDVVDAIELAETLGAGGKPGGADTIITAWAVMQPASPLTDPDALFRWLSAADPQLQREQGTPVVDRILDAGPPADVLQYLDAAAAQGRISLDPATARGRLLSAEIAEVRAGGVVPVTRLAPVTLDFAARRDAQSELSSALLLSSGGQIDRLLRLALRHGIDPGLPALQECLHKFVGHWLDDETAAYDPAGWAHGASVLDLARDELRDRLIQRGAADVLGPLRRLQPHLVLHPDDPTDPLDFYLKAAAIATVPARKRPGELRALLERISGLADHDVVAAGIQRALMGWDAVGPVEAFTILTSLPPSARVEPRIAEIAAAELRRRASKPDESLLDLLADLDRRGLMPSAGRVGALRTSDQAVQDFIEATREGRLAFGPAHARRLTQLRQVDPAVLGLRMRPLLTVCVDGQRVDLAARLLRVIPLPQRRPLLNSWAGLLQGSQPVNAAVWGMSWIFDPDLSGDHRGLMIKAIEKFAAQLSPVEHERWIAEVQDRLSADQLEEWARISGNEPPRLRRGLFFRDRDSR